MERSMARDVALHVVGSREGKGATKEVGGRTRCEGKTMATNERKT